MKKRLNEIKSQAIEARKKLSYDMPEQQKYIPKLDKIIRGTTYVKWMLVFSIVFSVLFFIASVFLFYPDVGIILGFSIAAVMCGVVCYFAGFIQAKLYGHTINKTLQLLDSTQ